VGFWDVVKASLKAGVRNPGDVGGTLQDFREQQESRKAAEQLLGRTATLGIELEAQRVQALTWTAKRLAEGHSVNLETTHRAGEVLGYSAILRFHMGGEKGRVDVFYGGRGTPMGPNHGHIVVKHGKVISWEAPGADGSNRQRIV
jgi:hypothetical protein